MYHSLCTKKNGKNILKLILVLLLISNGALWEHTHRAHPRAYAAGGVSPQALTVYGQGGSFTTSATGVTATTLSAPRDAIEDSSGNLYISDFANNRVLYYASGSTTATRVYGQGGSFTSNTINNGGISANSLNGPQGLALDSSGNLYIADNTNNRVLYYASGSTTATRVYGQGGSFTSNGASTSTIGLSGPNNIALDSSGNLYVADTNNNRVLYYPSATTTATVVYGQAGSFATSTANNGGISATSMSHDVGVTLDSSNNLYVADAYNNRVLYFPSGSTTATRVYGQGGSFTTSTANNGGVSATSMNTPITIAVDGSNNLYITDGGNSRVLYFPSGSTTAIRVYGQAGSFTSNTANNGGISATSLNLPYTVYVDSSGNIYVADTGNNRVLKFQVGLSVTGQPPASTPSEGTFSTAASLIDVGSGATFSDFTGTVSAAIKSGSGTSGATLSGTTSITASGGVATFSNLYIDLAGSGYILTLSSAGAGSGNTTTFSITAALGLQAITVYGQTGSFTANNGFNTASGLYNAKASILDSSGNLYIADTSHHRVLYYTSGTTTATRVYGQAGSFTTGTVNNGGISATSLDHPFAVALDSSGNLYVADTSNNRVLYYPSGTTTATRVYGQNGSFTTNLINNTSGTANTVSTTSLSGPLGLTLDSSGNLYVSDSGNNRVLYYPSGTTTATRVYGQNGSFTANLVNNTSGTANTVSATSLDQPTGITLDNSNNLYLSDVSNHRVLYYPSGTTTATLVYGQNGSFTANLVNNTSGTANTISATSLNSPQGLDLDNGNNLYIADSTNHRVLYYPSGSTTATRAYGQAGGFTTNLVNNTSGTVNAISANSLDQPYDVNVDSSGNIYVADSTNNRLLIFQTSLKVTSQPPASTMAGSSFGTIATLIDVGSGTVFYDFSGTVTAAIKSGTGTSGATLGGTTSNASGNGIMTLTALTINKSGTGYVLTLNYPGVGSVNTNTFTIAASTLVGYWPFNEGSGTTTKDWSTNANAGTITGASWTIGQVNSALSFNGTSNYVSMGTPAALQFGAGSFTAMAWFKTTSTAGYTRMINQGVGSWNGGFTIGMSAYCTGCVDMTVGGSGSGATSLVAGPSGAYNDGNWHQVAMVINQTAQTAQLYVDGVAQTSSVLGGTCGTASGTNINIASCTSLTATTTDPFAVGVYTGASGTFQYFNGSIDEVRLYNSALTSAQIQTQYTNDTNNLEGYWPLDENTGTTTSDYSPNSNTGAITGGTWSSSGQVNGALGFNGSDNVLMGNQSALQFGINSFTITSWFKTTATVNYQRIVSMGNYNYTSGYLLGLGPSGTSCAGCVGGSIGGGGTLATSLMFYGSTAFNDGNWHQAAMVINQTNSTAQIYVDGVAQTVTTQSGSCGTASGTSVNIAACTSLNASSTASFTVSSYNQTSQYFNGSLDEVRTYDRALSSSQMTTLYTNDTNPTPAGYWPFDENTGTTAYDATTNHDNGTLTSGPTWTTGKINSALSFNGTSNYVSMGTPSGLQFASTSSITAISWFKTTSTTFFERLMGEGVGNWNAGFTLVINDTCGGCIGGFVGGVSQATTLNFGTTTSFNDGNWHQAVLVINRTTNLAQIYVDGVAQTVSTVGGTCGTASGTTVNIASCTSLTNTTTDPFTVGAYTGSGGPGNYFSGSLDEPRIYGVPLSSQEVLSRYTSDVNALSEYATNATFSGTVNSTATYTLPIAITYQLTPAPGWSLTITSTTLTSGSNTLPTTASKITSVANTCTSTCTPTTMTNTISSFPITVPAGTTAPTAVKFFGTAAATGTGTYTVTPTISVTIPITAKTGAYSSTVTLTAATGP